MIRCLRPQDFKKTPWKNGLGITREFFISPIGADFLDGSFDWRVSSAKIQADGAFSSFDGYDRHLLVLRGNGLALSRKGAARKQILNWLDCMQFAGEESVACKLEAGEVEDINLFVRRGSFTGEINSFRLAIGQKFEWSSDGYASMIFLLEGELAVISSNALLAGQALLATDLLHSETKLKDGPREGGGSGSAAAPVQLMASLDSVLISIEVQRVKRL